MFDEPLLHWKYWRPWATWSGSRSFVLTRGERLIAHCAAMPLSVRHDGRDLTLLYPCDWAAEPGAVGSGAVLLQHMVSLADGMVIVGGSSMTQRMAEPLGFRAFQSVTRFAAPCLSGRGAAQALGLDVRRSEALPDAFIQAPVIPDDIQVRYPASVLTEWLDCPAARVRYYEVATRGSVLGAFLLSFTPGQARLLELWPSAQDVGVVTELVRAARCAAESEPGSMEIVAMANTPLEDQALRQAGFLACGAVPMFAFSGIPGLLEGRSIRYQLLHGDMGFLHHGVPEVWAGASRGSEE